MSGELRLGQFCQSTAGRDKGEYYLILGIINKSIVLVVNGKGRKIDSPKKKNIKHLKVYPDINEEIEKELLAGKRVTNLDVLRAIKNIIVPR